MGNTVVFVNGIMIVAFRVELVVAMLWNLWLLCVGGGRLPLTAPIAESPISRGRARVNTCSLHRHAHTNMSSTNM
jgi:hypothetical protein